MGPRFEDAIMDLPAERVERDSRVDEHVSELARAVPNARELSGIVAGTSEETAALFNSGHTLAADNTGKRPD